jgi:hypothetical protein
MPDPRLGFAAEWDRLSFEEPDRLDARLPFRWRQGKIGKTPVFIIPIASD